MSTTSKRKERKDYRAISGGVTQIALIALAVVIIGAVGAYAFNTAANSKAVLSGQIVDAKLVRGGISGAGTFAVTVKNTGTVGITNVSITLTGGPTGSNISIGPIPVGTTLSGSANIATGITAPGTIYTATVTYTGQNGQTQTDTFNVTVEGM